ncbi:MAG: MFS transporter [Globicatella sulfidifaciens]|uniref:MFS transporter n=2 Tax=Globicatella sulfidifaciens TaxID=136093 RepID=A0A7X8H1C4_9LACT|nr:MFS transporter [Globicatella sulfidifaciens]
MLLFSFYGANTMVVSFLPLLLTYRGLSAQEIGWVLAIGPAVSIIAQPFWGFISDKFQTVRRVLIITLIGLLISGFFYFQAETLIIILGLSIIFYFFQSSIAPLSDSLAQRRAEQFGVPFGSIRTWGSIGFATFSILIGEVIEWTGIQYLIIPYFFMASVTLFISTRVEDVVVERASIQFKDLQRLFKNPPLILFLAVLFLVAVTHRMNDSYMSLLINELGGGDNIVGIAWFVGVVSEALVIAFAGKWFKKLHPLIFIASSGLIFSLRWMLYSLITIPIIIVGLQVLNGLSYGVFFVMSFQYVTRLIPVQLQTSGHLMYSTVIFGVSGIVASVGGGYLFEHFGGATLYFVMAIVALLGSCFILLYHIIIRKTTRVV